MCCNAKNIAQTITCKAARDLGLGQKIAVELIFICKNEL
jgi:hypothetical protein